MKLSPYVIACITLFFAGSILALFGEFKVGVVVLVGSLIAAVASIRDDLL
jgi:hypothetical protein